MKKHYLLMMVGSLLLSGLAISIKPKVTESEAALVNGHLFVQVEKESDLREGDTVFIGTLGGTVLGGLSGNPVFASESHVSGRSEDGKKYWTSYAENYQAMLLMRAEKGTGKYADYWSFKSLRTSSQESDYAHPTRGRYLAYGHEYSDSKYHDIQAYGDVNFADGKGDNTSWSISFTDNDNHNIIMKRYGEEYSTHIMWVYYGSTQRNNFGYYQNGQRTYDIAMYRLVEADQGSGNVELNIFHHPDQSIVYDGEYLDLSGLEMTIVIDKGQSTEFSFASTYENDHGFYEVTKAAKENSVVYCSYTSWNFVIHVTIIEDEGDQMYFDKVVYPKDDYRGTYILAAQDNAAKYQYLWASTGSVHDKSDYEYYNTIQFDNFNIDTAHDRYDNINTKDDDPNLKNHTYTIRHRLINDVSCKVLCAKDANNYLCINNNGLFDLTTTLGANCILTIDNDLNVFIAGQRIVFNDTREMVVPASTLESGSYQFRLFKYITDASTQAETFVTSFDNYSYANCDASGESETTITSTTWNEQAALFNALSADAQGYLGNLVYVHNAEVHSSDKDVIDRYDYILCKYGTSKSLDDFIERKGNSSYQENYVAPESLSNILSGLSSSVDTTTWIVIVISLVSLTSLGALVVLKKKRQ